jgi:diadenosine tetraphosphate (Ap4A) HIT family hydrolase
METNETYRCTECAFRLGDVIANFESGALAHYSDREFAGRCVLALHEHAEHLEELSPTDLTQLMQDVRRAGQAIRKATGATRINYAVLGNAAPHIHVHLIPRGGPGDLRGTDTPWGPPPPSEPLPEEEAENLRNRITLALE